MAQVIVLNGGKLKIEDVWAIACNKNKISIANECKRAVDESRHFVESVGQHVLTYGVNTGFGPMAQYIMSPKKVQRLQYNLIRSHAVGLGDTFSEEECMAIMVVRLNSLIKGKSGVRWELIKYIEFFINERIVPVVHKHGSVGASGDLVQLAEVALALIGEGSVYFHGEVKRTTDVLNLLGKKPLELQSKEGLALINGTAAMTGFGALVAYRAKRLFDAALDFGAMAYELFAGFDDPISQELQDIRKHAGQSYVASALRARLKSSQLIQKRTDLTKKIDVEDSTDVRKIDSKVQDIYSIRCMPQIYGPIYDTIENVIKVVTTEINSVTDNPVTNGASDALIHGGNFHGDYVSLEADKLKVVMTRLAQTIERHINLFLNPNLRDHLPPFLNLSKPGLDLALQGLQFVATSTTAEMQTLCYPNYVHTISTNADNQDIVSMGTNSMVLASKVVDCLLDVMSVYLITLSQAVDVMQNRSQLSSSSQRWYGEIREIFPAVTDDRDLSVDLKRLNEVLNIK